MVINCSRDDTYSTILVNVSASADEAQQTYAMAHATQVGDVFTKATPMGNKAYLKNIDVEELAPMAANLFYESFRDQIANEVIKWAKITTKNEPDFDFLRLITLTDASRPCEVIESNIDTLTFETKFDYIRDLKFTPEQLSKLRFDFEHKYDFDKNLADRIETFFYMTNMAKLQKWKLTPFEPINNTSYIEYEYFFQTLDDQFILTDCDMLKELYSSFLPYSKMPDSIKKELLGMCADQTKKIKVYVTPDLRDDKIFEPLFLHPNYANFEGFLFFNIKIRKHIRFKFNEINDELVCKSTSLKTVDDFIKFQRMVYKLMTMFTLNTNALSKSALNIYPDFNGILLPEVEYRSMLETLTLITVREYPEFFIEKNESPFLERIGRQLYNYTKLIYLQNSIFPNLNLNITIPQLIIENIISHLFFSLPYYPYYAQIPDMDAFFKGLLELLNDLILEFENEIPKIKDSYQIDGVESVSTLLCDFGNRFDLTFDNISRMKISTYFNDCVIFDTPKFKKTNLYNLIVRTKKYFFKPVKINMFLAYGETHKISTLQTAMVRAYLMQHSFNFNFPNDLNKIDFFN
ncbi:MAG: hypothetical protein LBF12_06235 [Christensenellaceae bacterium]|jgi:hypothetical protein|nr:hypothetical protein [Christensenellaceae bacterium]